MGTRECKRRYRVLRWLRDAGACAEKASESELLCEEASMGARHMRKETSKVRPAVQVLYYGILVLILALLAWVIRWHVTLPPGHKGQSYTILLVPIMLLVGHLAGDWRWPRRVRAGLNLLWWLVLALTLYGIFVDSIRISRGNFR